MSDLRWPCFVAFVLLGAAFVNTPCYADNKDIVCTIPAGGDKGVHYENLGEAKPFLWGPKGLAIDSDGSYVVNDRAANRLLIYDSECRFSRSLDVVADDIRVDNGYWIIGQDGQDSPYVWHLDHTGKKLETYVLPTFFGADAINEFGNDEHILINGENAFLLSDVLEQADPKFMNANEVTVNGVTYAIEGDQQTPGPTSTILVGEKRLEITAPHDICGIRFLKILSDGSFYVDVGDCETEKNGNIVYHEMVRHYDAKGIFTGEASVPSDDADVIPPDHYLTVDVTGQHVYALVNRVKGVEIWRLVFHAPTP